jgi:hypothetical protein
MEIFLSGDKSGMSQSGHIHLHMYIVVNMVNVLSEQIGSRWQEAGRTLRKGCFLNCLLRFW